MKILFVTHRYPPRTGGVETHVREIATRLSEQGHEVTVFSADAGNDVASEAIIDDVRVRRFRSICPNGAFYIAPQLMLAVRRANADLVHAHNYHAFPLLFATIGVTNERLVMTTHYHGESAVGVRNMLLSLYQPIGRWAVRQADEVIAVSEWEREYLRDDFGVDATVIPNGVNAEQFANAKPEKRDRPFLLCVGRLEEYKGIQHVIRSLSELSEYDLVVAGSGPYEDELEQIACEVDVVDRVEMVGYVDDNRLARLYAGADVYITLSEFEAYGMTVAEALTAGTPCIVQRAGALVDWEDPPACIGLSSITPVAIAKAVEKARKNKGPSISVPNWESVVEELRIVYEQRH